MMDLSALGERVDAVVIGASAGGVDALSLLIPRLPPTLRAAVLVVLHLPRERPSLLPSIFEPRAGVALREAGDKEPIEPGTVYFAPPDYHLLVDEGPSLALSADALVNFSRPSVDVLFESAAEVYGERLLGVILTGASHDGAAGLAAIGRSGGLTVVQHPESAVSRTMIDAALASCPGAAVCTLEEIGRLFETLGRTGGSVTSQERR